MIHSVCSRDISLWTKEVEQLTSPSLELYYRHANEHFECKCPVKPMENLGYLIYDKRHLSISQLLSVRI